MGRDAKPTQLKKLTGTLRKDREDVSMVSFGAIKSIPEPPSYFGDVARHHWNELLSELIQSGTIQNVDLVQLRLFCWYLQIIHECTERISKEGLVIEVKRNRAKQQVPHPCIKISNEATAIVNRIASRFGFDPVSRNKVKIADKKEEDAFMKVIKSKST